MQQLNPRPSSPNTYQNSLTSLLDEMDLISIVTEINILDIEKHFFLLEGNQTISCWFKFWIELNMIETAIQIKGL